MKRRHSSASEAKCSSTSEAEGASLSAFRSAVIFLAPGRPRSDAALGPSTDRAALYRSNLPGRLAYPLGVFTKPASGIGLGDQRVAETAWRLGSCRTSNRSQGD